MKKILLITVMGLLCLITKAQVTSSWIYSDKIDEMSSKKVYYAEISNTDSDRYTSRITLRNKNNSNDVLLYIKDAVINANVNGVNMRIKFDNETPSRYYGSLADDGSYDVVFIHPTANFIKKVKKAKKIIIEIEIYNGGTNVLHFDVDGLKWNQ